MIFRVAILLLALAFPAQAATWYVHPSGSGTSCTESSPCNWIYGTQTKATGSDTVRFFDGTYPTPSSGWLSARSGASSSSRITLEAINRRQATIQYNGPDDDNITMWVRDDNYTIKGMVIRCIASNGNHSNDCIKVGTRNNSGTGGAAPSDLADNVTFDDVLIKSWGSIFHCTGATNVSFLNSTLHQIAETTLRGEGYYLSSCCEKNNPCINFKSYNTVVSKYGENAIDVKDQTRNMDIRYTIFTDQRATTTGGVGVGTFVSNDSQGTGSGTSSAGNIVRDSMIFRAIAKNMFFPTDNIRFDFMNNVLWSHVPVGGGNGVFSGSSEQPTAIGAGNIHCPASDNVSEGTNRDSGQTPNQFNQATSVCSSRINEIIGVPGISSCEIGSVNNTTVVVNLQANIHGPISSVGTAGQLAVQYNLADQTETAIQMVSGAQARITMAVQPSAGQSVRIVPAIGAIKNSAYIGGKTCALSIDAFKTDYGGTAATPNEVPGIGGGVCGTNIAATPVTCLNNVDSAPPPAEGLSQAVWRFYGQDGAEGTGALSAELENISLSLGSAFRWRVGVRGGGTDAADRAYELAARVCNPTCGVWTQVISDHTSTGVTYRFDSVQENLAPTMNQLSLGGKTFLAGVFSEASQLLPSVAIATTQQVEWEFSLILPETNNPLAVGDTLELRIQHSDGTALATYNLPSITVSQVSVGYGGSFGGSVFGGVFR